MVTTEQVALGLIRAQSAGQDFFYNKMGGRDQMSCGFAWVEVIVERTNSPQAKALLAAGFKKDYKPRTLSYWNPSGLPIQNIDAKEVGAQAFADYLLALGLSAHASSRLD